MFRCVICWNYVCACMGAADQVDEAGQMSGLVDPATSDTGVCDDCWCDLGGAALRATWEPEVAFGGPEEIELDDC